MQKKEAPKTTKWQRWYKQNVGKTCAFEPKDSRGKPIPFKSVVRHQRNWLMAVKTGCAIYKIPDAGFFNPFDGFCLAGEPAWVVLFYDNNFYMIDIEVFLHEEKISKTKSIVENRAKEIAHFFGVL